MVTPDRGGELLHEFRPNDDFAAADVAHQSVTVIAIGQLESNEPVAQVDRYEEPMLGEYGQYTVDGAAVGGGVQVGEAVFNLAG